ncbi:MFS transporter [Curvibacter sp. APW13]|uniref:MFS transporter n=1 Tax=Curvibacter sp. APW13 TaxID=3077236 RepID=UPI0028E099E4|nr:MFS transporter [Curvibacter sp. APW13]MDT8989332.1 MFS transporter [Curvibacter sp. APW13]
MSTSNGTTWKDRPGAILIGLLFMHVLAHIDRNMLLGFSPQITGELSLSNAQYGFLTGAVWVLSYGFMATFMGSLADRFSRTKVIAAGVLIWSVCTAASGFAQDFGQMVVARFLVASGEAALVPAAVSLIAEVFSAQRRSSAVGVFFVGIPLGIGLAFVIAGSLGVTWGWRMTFMALGVAGVGLTFPLLLLKDDRGNLAAAERGAPFFQQLRAVHGVMKECKPLRQTVVGFVLVHFAFAGLSFVQLWLVRERGFDAAQIAKQMGGLQIVFGTLGAILGGIASDRLFKRFKGGHATVVTLLVLFLAPLMLTYRFAAPGSALFYVGMCAGFFLPLAVYGPCLTLFQTLAPASMRSTVVGVVMLLLNVVAIAIGNLAVGAISDRLTKAGSTQGLSTVLIATDVLVALSLWFFWRASLSGDPRLGAERDKSIVAH